MRSYYNKKMIEQVLRMIYTARINALYDGRFTVIKDDMKDLENYLISLPTGPLLEIVLLVMRGAASYGGDYSPKIKTKDEMREYIIENAKNLHLYIGEGLAVFGIDAEWPLDLEGEYDKLRNQLEEKYNS